MQLFVFLLVHSSCRASWIRRDVKNFRFPRCCSAIALRKKAKAGKNFRFSWMLEALVRLSEKGKPFRRLLFRRFYRSPRRRFRSCTADLRRNEAAISCLLPDLELQVSCKGRSTFGDQRKVFLFQVAHFFDPTRSLPPFYRSFEPSYRIAPITRWLLSRMFLLFFVISWLGSLSSTKIFVALCCPTKLQVSWTNNYIYRAELSEIRYLMPPLHFHS